MKNWLVLLNFLGIVFGFQCDDGCNIEDPYVDDDFCDCAQCEDELEWNCEACPGCPSTCGGYVECSGEPLTTAPPQTTEYSFDWYRQCTADSPCIGQSLECWKAGDCVLQCLGEGVCANSSLVCGQSATGGCHVHCDAPDSCGDVTVESERDSTVRCLAEDSCKGLTVFVGRHTPNLTLNATCDAPRACFGSRFELHSEAGAAFVHCADLRANDSETCEELTVACHIAASGRCEASSGGQYSCDGGDANAMLCDNSALCAADADCFTIFETATLSFLISNVPLAEKSERGARVGGAVAVVESTNALLELADCRFAANVAEESGAAVAANGQNEETTILLRNASFVANVAQRFAGAVAMTEKMRNGLQLANCVFEANEAQNGYSAGVFAKAPLAWLRVANCTFNGSLADDSFKASAIFVEAIDGVEVANSSFEGGEDVFVRKAQSIELTGNELKSALTLLNSDKAAIGSLLMEGNAMHSTTALRSFPVSLSLEVVENSAKHRAEVCPKCELTVAVNGTDLFGNDYSPLQWCDSQKACFDVQLQWAAEIEDMLADFGTDDGFWQGKGQSTLWLAPLRKHATVNLSLQCAPATDVSHVCAFERWLSVGLPVTDCPKAKYERDTGGGHFECEAVSSLSADKYAVVEKEFFWVFPLMAALLAAFVVFLWLKDKSIVPPFKLLCCNKRVEDASFWAPAIYAWHCFDFLSDVNLAQSLFRVYFHSAARGFNEATNWQWLALAILSTVFVALPFVLNAAFAWKLPHLVKTHAANNSFARDFVRNKAKVVAFACLWSGNFYATLQLVNSRILGFKQFYMGLTKSQMRAFLKYRVYNVWSENFPQLLIQVLALIKDATDGDGSNVSMAVLLSFISSLISATTVLFEKAFAKSEVGAEVDFEATIDVRSANLEPTRLPRADLLAFGQNQHRFRNVARALCQDLDIQSTELQLGYTALKGNGCVVYGQMSAAASKAAAHLGQRTYECIWKQVFGGQSPVTGSMQLLTDSAPPAAGRVLSLSTEDSVESDEHCLADTLFAEFCAKHGDNCEADLREICTLFAHGQVFSQKHGDSQTKAEIAPIALEMVQLKADE